MSRGLLVKMGLVAILIAVIIIGYNGCGGKSSSGSSSVAKLVLTGKIGSGYLVAYHPTNLFEKFCYLFSPTLAWANGGDVSVNKILAVPYNGGSFEDYSVRYIKEIPINLDKTFTMSLEKDMNWLLILVDTTQVGRENQFVSYVALNAGSGESLLQVPVSSATVNLLDLGNLVSNTDIAIADNTAITATTFSMTAQQLTTLAKGDDMLKIVKNLFINYDSVTRQYYLLHPQYEWRGDYNSLALGTYTTPTNYAYHHYLLMLETNDPSLTLNSLISTNGVAPAKVCQLIPPLDVPTVNNPALIYSASNPISNAYAVAADIIPDNCGAGPQLQYPQTLRDFRAQKLGANMMFDLGSANLSGTAPAGIWLWIINGVTNPPAGQFDVAITLPLVGDKQVKGFVPSIKVNTVTEGAYKKIANMQIKWYVYDDGVAGYVVADSQVLKYLTQSFVMVMSNNSQTTSRFEQFTELPLTTSLVTPTLAGGWYLGTGPTAELEARRIGFGYNSGGVEYFFAWEKPQ
jgi:hypothetical protein